MNNSYPLASTTWDMSEIEAIKNVISSGNYSMGKYVKLFEEKFSKVFGSKYSIMVNSGSSANLLAIASLFYRKRNPLKRGDEVIVPAVSWSTTYSPLQQYGLKLKFVDIDLETLNYDLTSLKSAVTNKTKLIVVVNLLGNPNDFKVIKEIILDKNIDIVEDNCESMGAEYELKKTGTIGTIGTFSSFFSHHISTMEGGIICTDERELYDIILSLRAHGWTRNLDDDNSICNKTKDNFTESFRFILPGYNLRPLEFSGAIGLEQIKKLPKFVKQRKKNHEVFKKLFKNDDRFIIQKEIGSSSWFGFYLIIDNNLIKRSDVFKILEKNNIDFRPIVSGNFSKSESLKYYNYEIHGEMKNAEYIDSNGFFIGNHHYDLTEQIKYLHKILNNLK